MPKITNSSDTDYIVLKIAEAMANSDTVAVNLLKTQYATQLAARQSWRNDINNLTE